MPEVLDHDDVSENNAEFFFVEFSFDESRCFLDMDQPATNPHILACILGGTILCNGYCYKDLYKDSNISLSGMFKNLVP